jgi:hypothetical protein
MHAHVVHGSTRRMGTVTPNSSLNEQQKTSYINLCEVFCCCKFIGVYHGKIISEMVANFS